MSGPASFGGSGLMSVKRVMESDFDSGGPAGLHDEDGGVLAGVEFQCVRPVGYCVVAVCHVMARVFYGSGGSFYRSSRVVVLNLLAAVQPGRVGFA